MPDSRDDATSAQNAIRDLQAAGVRSNHIRLMSGGDGYTMFKDAKMLLAADKAPKDSDVFEKAITDSPNSTISPRIEGRITRLN